MHVPSLLLSFSLFLSFAAALSPLIRRPSEKSWTPARETGQPGDHNRLGWTPKPTGLPAPGPRYGGMDLLRRANDFSIGRDTCGFVSASTPAPVTCVKSGSYCTDDGAGNMDCCVGDYKQCTSTMYSACLDFSASQKGACSGQGPRTICCWSEEPSCYTLLMEATASPGKFYSIFQCQAFKGIDTLYASPPGISITSSETSSSSSSSSASTSTSTTSSTTTTSRDGGNTAPPGGSSSGDSNNSPSPIGPIVGGVVGGVAAIGLIAFLFFYFIIRNRRKNDMIQDGQMPPATTQALPPKQPDMSTTVSSPQSAYQSPVGGPGQGGLPQQPQQYQQYTQPQYSNAAGEYKAYNPIQQAPLPQQQQHPYSANSTSPYGYYPPSSTSPVAPPNQGFGVPQQPQQQYSQGPYPPPQQPLQPPQQAVVFNELPAQSALGSEGHRAELN